MPGPPWEVQRVVLTGHNYLYAYVPEHPKATKTGYVYEHRIVMENALGRMLTDDEIVHHKNHDGRDNRLDNLALKSRSSHASLHAQEGTKRVAVLMCPSCKVVFERARNQTHLVKGGAYSCCSRSCRGRLGRLIQLHGITADVAKAIEENVVMIEERPRSLVDQAPLS